jgi:hypothetical protein
MNLLTNNEQQSTNNKNKKGPGDVSGADRSSGSIPELGDGEGGDGNGGTSGPKGPRERRMNRGHKRHDGSWIV